jgi:DivIVA domain-containing protein
VPLSPRDIEAKEFLVTLRGYDKDEVRAFLSAVATALDIPIASGMVRAEGDLDFRGTLGVSKEVPVGFAQIRLSFTLDTDAPQETLEQLQKLTERYCVVYQTIRNGPPVEMTLARAGAAPG